MEIYTKTINKNKTIFSLIKNKNHFYEKLPKRIKQFIYVLKDKHALAIEIYNNKVIDVDIIIFPNVNVIKSANKLSEIEFLIMFSKYKEEIEKGLNNSNNFSETVEYMKKYFQTYIKNVFGDE